MKFLKCKRKIVIQLSHSKMGKNMKGPSYCYVKIFLLEMNQSWKKNARKEKEFEKCEKVIMNKDKRSVSNHVPFPSAM